MEKKKKFVIPSAFIVDFEEEDIILTSSRDAGVFPDDWATPGAEDWNNG